MGWRGMGRMGRRIRLALHQDSFSLDVWICHDHLNVPSAVLTVRTHTEHHASALTYL